MRSLFAMLAAATVLLPSHAVADHSPRHMQMFMSTGCECCTAWAEIAREHGFEVDVQKLDDIAPLKDELGVVEGVESCHTTKIDGYVVEGHVPMEAVEKLLSEKPAVRGIAAPGMPAGSPGMGDDPNARFDVMSFGAADSAVPTIFFKAGAE
jgi:hypothetical protein